jgi:hypothetical protein
MFGLVEIDDGARGRIDLGPLRFDVLHADRLFDGLADRGSGGVLVAAVGQAALPSLSVSGLAEADLPYEAAGSDDLGDAAALISCSCGLRSLLSVLSLSVE